MYVAKNTSGRFFSMQACYGTKLQRRLALVECAEQTQDAREYVLTKWAIQLHGSVRNAVTKQLYSTT